MLDCSGSMEHLIPETKLALNNFIAEQKKIGGDAHFSLYTFATACLPYYAGIPMEMVQPVAVLTTGGSTALYDAMSATIDKLGRRLGRMPEAVRPNKVVFVVLTDGHENASIKITKAGLLEKIKHQKEKYSWQFLFLGADADAFDDAAAIGIMHSQAMSWEADRPGGIMRAMVASSNAIGNYRSNNTSEAVYSVQDRINNNSK